MKCAYLPLAWMFVLVANWGICPAQTQCPWMNAATASGFLGGEVQMTVTGVNDGGDATCKFARSSNAADSPMLRIAVHTMPNPVPDFSKYLAQCATEAITLNGIGNQAVQCIVSPSPGSREELIVGRVRNRAFIITIRADWVTRSPSSRERTRNPINDRAENIAEQVAGSVF